MQSHLYCSENSRKQGEFTSVRPKYKKKEAKKRKLLTLQKVHENLKLAKLFEEAHELTPTANGCIEQHQRNHELFLRIDDELCQNEVQQSRAALRQFERFVATITSVHLKRDKQ